MPKLIRFSAALFLLCPPLLCAEVSKEETLALLYQEAVKAYRAGDAASAVSQLEALVQAQPGHIKAKQLLTEALVVGAVEAYLLGDEEKSFQNLNRAMEVTPDAEAVQRLYEKVRKNRFQAPGRTDAPGPAAPASDEAFQRMVAKIMQAQDDMVAKTGRLLESSEQEKKKILESLEKRETLLIKEIGFGRKYSLLTSVGGVLLVVLVVGAIIRVAQKIAARREKILFEQGEKFAQILHEQSGKALEHIQASMRSQTEQMATLYSTRALGNDTQEKLRRIDVIDAEIVQDGRDASRDLSALKSLLDDANPEVKARTVQVLLKYDAEEAYRCIQSMLAALSSDARLLAVKLLGGIATQRSADMLIQLLKEEDMAVKRQSIAALRGLMNENLPEPAKKEIEQALSFISESEGWIVK